MPRLLGAMSVGVVLGVVLVALPDSDRRVVSLSETHGPSLVDLVGSLVLTASWLPVPILAWRWRHRVSRWVWALAGLLAGAGGVALYLTISRDLGWWWVPAVAALVLAQVIPVVVAALRRPPRALPTPARRPHR